MQRDGARAGAITYAQHRFRAIARCRSLSVSAVNASIVERRNRTQVSRGPQFEKGNDAVGLGLIFREYWC